MQIHKSTLLNLLYRAIRLQGEREKRKGYRMDSGMLQAWKEILSQVESGENFIKLADD